MQRDIRPFIGMADSLKHNFNLAGRGESHSMRGGSMSK